jgi:hypothetical protein
MTLVRRRARWSHVALVVAALAACAPIVRWCPLDWSRVPLAALAECTLASGDALGPCPMARRQAVADACPLHQGSACASAPACASRSLACDPPATPAHGRAYCLDAPAPAAKSHAPSPRIDPPQASAALAVLALAMEPPDTPSWAALPALEARPPTRDAEARPPIRGPPLPS